MACCPHAHCCRTLPECDAGNISGIQLGGRVATLGAPFVTAEAFKEALRTRPLFLSLELGPHIDLQRPDASVARILRSSDGEVAEHREDSMLGQLGCGAHVLEQAVTCI